MMARSDVIVVGAGVAGLAAATRLAESGMSPLVLEASKLAGGRARSWTDPVTGDVVDNGQHLLMGCFRHTLAFLERIGTRHLIQFQERLRVDFADADGEGGSIDCPPLPGRLSLLAGFAFYRGLSSDDVVGLIQVARDVGSRRSAGPEGAALRQRAAEESAAPAETERDESADAYLTRLRQAPRARRNFWDPLIVATLNERPERASARTLRAVLDLGLLAGAEASRLGWARVGLGDLYANPAQDFLAQKGGVLRGSASVASVRPGKDDVEVVLRSGESLKAALVILAVQPGALVRLLPPELAAAAELSGLPRLTSSPILAVNLWFDRPIVDSPFVGLLGTKMQWLFNKGELLDGYRESLRHAFTPEDHADRAGQLIRGGYVSLVVSGARREVELDSRDLVGIALSDLHATFPFARKARLLHSLVIKEREATVSPSVGWDRLRPGTTTSEPRLFLAGDWTATGLPATIESASLSGHLAAEAVMRVKG